MPDPKKMTDLTDRRRYSNAVRLDFVQQSSDLSARLGNDEITISQWQDQMKSLIREANKQHYITGKGGVREDMKPKDWGRIGRELRNQYDYLRKFANDIETRRNNGQSLGFIENRSRLYMESAQVMFWKSAVPVDLPQVPRDGKTECKSSCKCQLDFEYEYNKDGLLIAVKAYWRLRPAEHCKDCKRLSREWNPFMATVVGEALGPTQQSIDLFMHFEKVDDVIDITYPRWIKNQALATILLGEERHAEKANH